MLKYGDEKHFSVDEIWSPLSSLEKENLQRYQRLSRNLLHGLKLFSMDEIILRLTGSKYLQRLPKTAGNSDQATLVLDSFTQLQN
jgi:hypothetical protein